MLDRMKSVFIKDAPSPLAVSGTGEPKPRSSEARSSANRLELLAETLVHLSTASRRDEVMSIVRTSARRVSGADGVAIVLRDGDRCHYVDEDAIAPLWKGLRFPMAACISGWAMLHGETVVIPDITLDHRIPQDLYRPTFVRSVLMVPMLGEEPWGAIGAYWSHRHVAEREETHALETLARAAGASLRNLDLLESLSEKQARLEADAVSARQLQDISTAMIREDRPEALYQRIVDAAASLMRADGASLQEYDRGQAGLRLLAYRGLHPESAAFWGWVTAESGCSSATSLRTGQRTIVDDIERSPAPTPSRDREEYRRSGIGAVQATPLMSRAGRLLGVLSTHWQGAQTLAEDDLGRFDVLARQAADMIERAQGEVALRESERRLQQASRSAGFGVYELDGVTRRVTGSPRLQEMLGLVPAEDLPLDAMLSAVHPEDRERVGAEMTAALRRRGFHEIEFRVENPDGSIRWILDRGETLETESSASTGAFRLLGTLMDVTERKRHALSMAEQSRILGLVAEGRPLDECLTELTRSLTHLHGACRTAVVLADPGREIIAQVFSASLPDSFARAITGARISAAADATCPTAIFTGTRVVSGDIAADERWSASWRGLCRRHGIHAGHSTPVFRPGGPAIAAVFLAYEDAHHPDDWELRLVDTGARLAAIAIERHATFSALRDSESQLRDLANAMPHLVWTADATGRVDFYNERAQEYAGLAKNADGRWTWAPVLHPDDRDATLAAWTRSVETGVPYQIEHRVEMAGGGFRWHISRGIAARDDAGRIVRWYGTATDIHDLVMARENLLTLNGELEQRVGERTAQLIQSQKMEAIGRLTGGVAHDFNNLLQGIGGCLSVLDPSVPEGRPRVLYDAALQAVERGARLTQSLLAFARRQRLAPERTDLGSLLDGMRPLMERALGGLITIDLALPTGAATALVDPAQFEAAILNLAINARDAMPDGGRLTLAVRETRVERQQEPGRLPDLAPGAYVAVTVTDTGTGMDAATLAHVFEPFFTTKEVGKGSGLGLAMVHGMAAQSGGGVHIASAPGQGTTVTLYLPRGSSDTVRVAKPSPAQTPRRSGTVLLVDDDVMVRAGVEAMLEGLGYAVVPADGGAAALDALRKGAAIDALLTDYAMPGMTGAALVREAQRLRPGLPVVLITGYADAPAGLERVLVLPKPFRITDLAACLERALTRGPADALTPS